MKNKIILITGATDGIGKASAKSLARQGHTVIIHGRNKEKALAVCEEIKAETGNKQIDILIADLLILTDVKRAAEEFKKKYSQLDVLINNAGAIFGKVREVTKEGLEKTMTLNLFSPLLLMTLLIDVLAKSPSPRIVNVNSEMHKNGGIPDLADIQLENSYKAPRAYGLAKLYNIWITRHLISELAKQGQNHFIINLTHPGAVNTRFGADSDKGFFVNLIFKVAMPFLRTPEKAAVDSVYLATSEKVEHISGKYIYKEKEAKIDDRYYSAENEQIVWDYCMKIINPYL